jgi:hypothetical protein
LRVLERGFHVEADRGASLMRAITGALYAACYIIVLWRLPRDADVPALVRASRWAVLLLLLIAKWEFHPWYLLWVAPIGALLPGSRAAWSAATFSFTALLLYGQLRDVLALPPAIRLTVYTAIFLVPISVLSWPSHVVPWRRTAPARGPAA